VRLAVSRAIAIETPRGWRIAKEKAAHKIDVVIALAMAAHAAMQAPHVPEEPAVGPIFDSVGCTVPGGSAIATSSAEVPTPPARSFLEACERFLAENRAAWEAHYANPTPPPAPAPRQSWDDTPGGQAWHRWRDSGGYGF